MAESGETPKKPIYQSAWEKPKPSDSALTAEGTPPPPTGGENPKQPEAEQPPTSASASPKEDDREPKFTESQVRYEHSIENVDRFLESLIPIVTAKATARAQAIFSKRVDSGEIKPEQFNEMVEEQVNKEVMRYVTDLQGKFLYLRGGGLSAKERSQALRDFQNFAGQLVSEGILEQDKFMFLINESNNISALRAVAEFEIDRLIEQAGGYSERGKDLGMSFTEEQAKLLDSLKNEQAFEKLLKDTYNILEDPEHGWEALYKDAKGIFSGILSVIDNRPNDFFDQAFNVFTMEPFFNAVISRFEAMGRYIKSNPEFEGKTVKIRGEISMLPDPGEPAGARAKQRMAYDKVVELDLGEAIGPNFVNRMRRYRNIVEFLHNGEIIANLGMGWETLAQQAARFSNADIDWFFTEEEALSDIYNLYMTNLIQDLAANNHVVSQSIGLPDRIGLDEQQRKAYYQLLAMKGVVGDPNEVDIITRRNVRLASAIAKVVTGEFWGALITSRMLIQEQPEFGENGEIIGGKLNQLFLSGHHAGFEKMLSAIDPALTWERFNVPQFLNIMAYSYTTRDLDHAPGQFSRYGKFDHTLVYDLRKRAIDARELGRDDELADFDEENVFFQDWAKTNVVDMFLRSGWRFNEVNAFIVRNEAGGILYRESLENIKKEGNFPLMLFVDRNFNQQLVDVALGPGHVKLPAKPKEGSGNFEEKMDEYNREISALKIDVYDKLIFDRVRRISPSKFLAYEERRFTPRGERMLRDDLMDYLRKEMPWMAESMLEEHAFDLFVSSLSMAEKIAWIQRNKSASLTDENFGVFDLEENKNRLTAYYESYRRETGAADMAGVSVSFSQLDAESYFSILKGFYSRLNESISLPRTNRRQGRRIDETLSNRFAYYYQNNIGIVKKLIRGDDLDFRNFHSQQAGRRVTERWLNESNTVATKSTEAMNKLLNEAIPEFVKHKYETLEQLQQALAKTIIPTIKEITDPVARSIDKAQADEWGIRIAAFVLRAISKDTAFRTKLLGPLLEAFSKNMGAKRSSLAQEYWKSFIHHPTFSLDIDGVHEFNIQLMSALDLPHDEYKTEAFETFRLGPLKFRRPVKSEHSKFRFHFEQLKRITGDTEGLKTLQGRIPLYLMSLVLLVAALAHQAYKQESEQH